MSALCVEPNEVKIEVGGQDATIPVFKVTGVSLTIVTPHDVDVTLQQEVAKQGEEGVTIVEWQREAKFVADKAENVRCVPFGRNLKVGVGSSCYGLKLVVEEGEELKGGSGEKGEGVVVVKGVEGGEVSRGIKLKVEAVSMAFKGVLTLDGEWPGGAGKTEV